LEIGKLLNVINAIFFSLIKEYIVGLLLMESIGGETLRVKII
jgi:hypothetical protein